MLGLGSKARRQRVAVDFDAGGQAQQEEERRRQQAAQAQAARRQRIQEMIHKSPLFQVFTFDALHWIEPFRCSLVSVAFEREAEMIRWIESNGPWKDHPLKSLRVLQGVRWFHWLRENIMREPRLRYFHPQNGQWLNPFNACWEPQVLSDGGTLTRSILQAMAQALLDCPQVQDLNQDPSAKLLQKSALSARVAGDSPFSTGELPVYESSAVRRHPSNPLAQGADQRLFATQDLSRFSADVDNCDSPGSCLEQPGQHNWHIVLDGLEMAAISWPELQQLAEQKRINPQTQLRPESGQQFITAAQLPGLFSHGSGERRWAILVDGLRSMPMTVAQLRDLIRQGRLRPDSTLVPEVGGQPLQARACPGLYSVGTTTAAYPIAEPIVIAAGQQQQRRADRQQDELSHATQVVSHAGGAVSERWLVQIKSNEQMLVNTARLRRMVREGLVVEETPLRRDDMEAFVPARRIRGLF